MILDILAIIGIYAILGIEVIIVTRLCELKKEEQEEIPINNDKRKKRNHPVISNTNFGSVLEGRKEYDKFKNKDGLYEPVQPHSGIRINNTKED